MRLKALNYLSNHACCIVRNISRGVGILDDKPILDGCVGCAGWRHVSSVKQAKCSAFESFSSSNYLTKDLNLLVVGMKKG